ncbi:MAG: DMT family transporter [Proteobacteria bacterium]|nr:DMT family transporter [Pseudomonadota bacterium]
MGGAAPSGRAEIGRGIALMVVSMLLFAGMDGVSKYLVGTYSIVQILWLRFIFFVVFALWVARRRGVVAALRSRRPGLQILRSLLLVTEIGTFVFAFRFMPLADTHAIAAIAPLLVTALSVPLLGERVGVRRWSAVLVGFLGVLVIIRPGFAAVTWMVAIPLAGAIQFDVYQILVRIVSRVDTNETTLLYSAVVGVVVLSAIGPLQWQTPDPFAWIMFVVVALFGSGAHFTLIKALEAAPASVVQPFSYTLMIGATIVGFVFFGDFPDGWTILGAAIVTASGVYAIYRERARRAAAA